MDDEVRAGGQDNNPLKDKSLYKNGVMMVILSFILSLFGFFSLLSLAPLLVFAARYGKKKGSIIIVIAFALTVLWKMLRTDNVFSSSGLISLAFGLYIPLSLSAAGIIWIYSNRYKVLSRMLLSIVPALLLAVIAIVAFWLDRALFEVVYNYLENAFAAYFAPIFELMQIDLNIENFFFIFLLSCISMIAPFVLSAVCANCFVYETALHSRESNWEDRVAGFEYSTELIWGFIASWALVLLFYFISIPVAYEIIALNLGLLFCVLYAVQGFAVVFSWLHRPGRETKSFSLFVLILFVSTLIPGINFIILLGLPILGLLESFFDLKKIGVKNEDYS